MALGGSMGDDDVIMSLSDGGRSPYLYRLQRVRALRRTAPPLWVTRTLASTHTLAFFNNSVLNVIPYLLVLSNNCRTRSGCSWQCNLVQRPPSPPQNLACSLSQSNKSNRKHTIGTVSIPVPGYNELYQSCLHDNSTAVVTVLCFDHSSRPIPVSYTHLDVYKRQCESF